MYHAGLDLILWPNLVPKALINGAFNQTHTFDPGCLEYQASADTAY